MDKVHVKIAKSLMEDIAYSNGAVDRWHPMKYPKKHLNEIAIVAGSFFDKYPELLTDDDIMEMCDGEVTEVADKYGKLEGWDKLNIALNNYFNRD